MRFPIAAGIFTLLAVLQQFTMAEVINVVWINYCGLAETSDDVVYTWPLLSETQPPVEFGGLSDDMVDAVALGDDVWYINFAANVTTIEDEPAAGWVVLCTRARLDVPNSVNNCHWNLLGTLTLQTGPGEENTYQWTTCNATIEHVTR